MADIAQAVSGNPGSDQRAAQISGQTWTRATQCPGSEEELQELLLVFVFCLSDVLSLIHGLHEEEMKPGA